MNYISCPKSTLFFHGVRAPSGPRPHYRRSGTPHSAGLLWKSDQPVAGTSTWQPTPLTTDRHPCCLRNSNPQSQQVRGLRPTTRPLESPILFMQILNSKNKQMAISRIYLWTEGVLSVRFEYPNVLEWNLLAALYVWNRSTRYMTILVLSNNTHLLTCKYSCVFGIVFLQLIENTQR